MSVWSGAPVGMGWETVDIGESYKLRWTHRLRGHRLRYGRWTGADFLGGLGDTLAWDVQRVVGCLGMALSWCWSGEGDSRFVDRGGRDWGNKYCGKSEWWQDLRLASWGSWDHVGRGPEGWGENQVTWRLTAAPTSHCMDCWIIATVFHPAACTRWKSASWMVYLFLHEKYT